MSELPADDDHETIHLGGRTAVVVPLDEYLRLREAARPVGERDHPARGAAVPPRPGRTAGEERHLPMSS